MRELLLVPCPGSGQSVLMAPQSCPLLAGKISIKVIPNGVPWPEKQPDNTELRANIRQSFGLTSKARLVIFVAHGGVQAAYKSGDFWERIWEGLKAKAPDAVCFMIGGRSSQQQGALVHWPYLPPEKLWEVMLAADLLVYPTRADNHPLVVLEAMAAGCPVVSYAVGGINEQIEDGRTGRLVPEGDEAALIRTAQSFIGNPGRTLAARTAWFRGQRSFPRNAWSRIIRNCTSN